MARFADDSPNESEVDVKPLLYACKVTNKIRNSNSFPMLFSKLSERLLKKLLGSKTQKKKIKGLAIWKSICTFA